MYQGSDKVIMIILLFVLTVASTVLIAFCLYSICKSKHLFKRPSILFVLNILLVHLYQGLIVLPLYAGKKYKFDDCYKDRIVCNAFQFTYVTSYYCSILSVLLYAIDRYLATHFVLQYKYLVTRGRVLALVLLASGYVVVLCSIPFVGQNEDDCSKAILSRNCSNCTYKPSTEWSIFMLIGNCVVPYVTLTILYRLISKTVLKFKLREKERNDHRLSGKISFKTLSETHSNRGVYSITALPILLAVSYFLLWFPSLFYYILRSFYFEKCFYKDFNTSGLENYLEFAAKYIALLDSIVSPVIYCLCDSEIGIKFKKKRRSRKKFSIQLLLESSQFRSARESII